MLGSLLSNFINPSLMLGVFLDGYYDNIEKHQKDNSDSFLIYRFATFQHNQNDLSKDIEVFDIIDNKITNKDSLKKILQDFDFASFSLNDLDGKKDKKIDLVKQGLKMFGIDESNMKEKANEMLGDDGLDMFFIPLIEFFEDLEKEQEVDRIYLFLSLQKGKKIVSYAHKDQNNKTKVFKRETLELFLSKIKI